MWNVCVICFNVSVGSEETLSVNSYDDDQALPGSPTDSGEEEMGNSVTPGTRGRRSDSGALLDMLAEVASQKLLFSPSKRGDKRTADGRLSATQMKGLSTNQLIELFSLTEFDEMRKWYTYRCAFDDKCSSKFVSFGSENKAKENFKDHLFTHLETLKSNDSLQVSKRRMSNARKTRSKTKSKESTDDAKEDGENPDTDEINAESKASWSENFRLQDSEPKVSAGWLCWSIFYKRIFTAGRIFI